MKKCRKKCKIVCVMFFVIVFDKFYYIIQLYSFYQHMSNDINLTKFHSIKSDNNEMLLSIPEANIEIYPKKILVYKSNQGMKTARYPVEKKEVINKSSQSSVLNQIETIQQLQQFEFYQTISLLDEQIAFQIIDDIKCVRIENIVQHHEVLKFYVNQKTKLKILHGLLRDKLPQIGFTKTYKIIEKIGAGKTSEVYLAQRIIDKKNFAVKIISVQNLNELNYKIFINEAHILRKLNHPNIIKLQNFCYQEGSFYLILQYLDGGTFKDQLKYNFPQTSGHFMVILYDILKSIQYLRQKAIVHRDIKPQNILIRKKTDGTNEYVLCDFGLSGFIYEKKTLFSKCGTPGFIAPQTFKLQTISGNLSHKMDIFPFGVLAHVIATGEPVFVGKTAQILIQLNQKCQIDYTRQIYQNLQKDFLKILKGSLAADPNQRLSSTQIMEILLPTFKQSEKQYRAQCKLKKQKQAKNNQANQYKQLKKSQKFYQLFLNKHQQSKNNKEKSTKVAIKQQLSIKTKDYVEHKQAFTKKKIQSDSVSNVFSKQSFKKSLQKMRKNVCNSSMDQYKMPSAKNSKGNNIKPKKSTSLIGSLWDKIAGKRQESPRITPKLSLQKKT